VRRRRRLHRVRPQRRGGVRQHLRPLADERCQLAGDKDGIGAGGWRQRVTDRLLRAMRLKPVQLLRRRNTCSRH
jgi:hypothetical protein